MSEKKKPEAKKLNPEVEKKYTVLPGIGIGEVNFKMQTIHLDQLTVAEADALVKEGFKALIAEKEAPGAPDKK